MGTTKEAIKEIRKHLSNSQLSVIVGAGFSKNASESFLSWKELLRDMIVEMYVDDAKRSDYEIDQLVDDIVAQKGYLAIASEYVKRYGYHEAIDHYIEQKIPTVKKHGDSYTLSLDGKEFSEPVDMSLHQLLVKLNWNNIYTFNYDNLLDIAGNTDKYDIIEKEIAGLSYKNNGLIEKKCRIENKIEDLKNRISEEEEKIKISTETKYIREVSAEDYEEIGEKIEGLEKKLKSLKTKVRNNKNKIEDLNMAQRDIYLLVDSAFKISLRKKRIICKLHGSIRLDETHKYGFDRDSRCHYIITQEDYDNYREKHEAFVSLMRIALLQDYFCMIGFSGDDPNFLSWIGWVKDIIDQRAQYDRNSTEQDADKAKIFYVDVSGEPLEKGEELFFKNHYIKHVPLLEGKDRKEKLNIFLESLKKEKEITINSITKYNSFWETDFFPTKDISEAHVMGFQRNEIRLQWNNLKYNRIPKLNSFTSHTRRNVVSKIEHEIEQGNNIDNDTAKLFLLAIKGELFLIDLLTESEVVKTFSDLFIKDKEVSSALKNNRARHQTLAGKKNLSDLKEIPPDQSAYESILRMFFNLNFTSARRKIDNWNSDDIRWKVIKSILGKMLEPEGKDLTALEDFDPLSYNNQELLYSLQALSWMMRWKLTKEERIKIDRMINTVKDSSFREKIELNNIDDNIKYLTKKISEENADPKPYGDNTVTFKVEYVNVPLVCSIQLLQHFIEIGIPLGIAGLIYYPKKDWYPVFKNIYELYPYPSLFYSLQYGNDNNFIRKIAQDYIYSNKLKSFCNDALIKMLQAYQMDETPVFIKNAILIAAPVFFMYVPNDLWQTEFETIYSKSDLSSRNENRNIRNPLYDFIIAGLTYSRNKSFNRKVLYKTLELGEQIDDIDNRMIIAVKKIVAVSKQPKAVKDSLVRLISKAKSVSNFFALFNLQNMLTKEQNKLFFKQLMEFDYVNCREPHMITAALSYAKGTELEKKIKADIIDNVLLWEHGIRKMKNGNYSIGHTSYLPIFTIQKHTSFSTRMLKILYDKLKISLSKILQYDKEIRGKSFAKIVNPGGVISEMFIFLEYNKGELGKQSDYNNILSQVQNVYAKIYGYSTIMDALVSSDKHRINKGIIQLSYRVQYLGFEHFVIEYMTIANIILKRIHVGLSNSILHFTDIVSNKTDDVDKKLFKPIIEKILDVYQPYFSDKGIKWDLDAKKESVENAMIILNKTLKKCKHPIKHILQG